MFRTPRGAWPGPDAVLWSPSGKATVLQDVGGHDYSWALAINSSGWSVGYSNTRTSRRPDGYRRGAVVADGKGDGASRRGRSEASAKPSRLTPPGRALEFPTLRTAASAWTRCCGRRAGKATVLQDAGGQGFSQPAAINASGGSVGFSLTASDGARGGAVVADGESYGASGRGRRRAIALPGAVNDAGRASDFRHLGPRLCEAVLWSPSGKATVLQEPGGVLTSFANAINASGWSVGYFIIPGFRLRGDAVVSVGEGLELGAMLGPA